MNKNLLIGAALVVLLLVGGYFLFANKSTTQTSEENVVDEEIPEISSEELGIDLELGSDRSCLAKSTDNQVRFTMNKTSDIKHVTWVVTYDADIPKSEQVEGASDKVNQSFENESDVSSGEAFTSEYGLMGTCSKNVCRCDTGVENVKFIFKVTKEDGKVYQAEKTLES